MWDDIMDIPNVNIWDLHIIWFKYIYWSANSLITWPYLSKDYQYFDWEEELIFHFFILLFICFPDNADEDPLLQHLAGLDVDDWEF